MLTIASQTFRGSRGGIARVSELTARVAIEAGYPLSLLSVQDEGGAFDRCDFWHGSGGSRVRFVASCAQAALRGDHILYDQLGTARAHNLYSKFSRPGGVWIHGIEVWKGTAAWERMRPEHLRAAKSVGFLVANSNYTRERAICSDKVFESTQVCWLATLEDTLPEMPALLDGPPIVLILGRLDGSAYKGHKELIETWASVLKGVPEARLIIAGDGPLIDRYRSMATSSIAANYIDIIGFVEESMLPELWRRAVVFSMPSRGEGFGLAYIEAMRWGIPVVASMHDAASEVNIHGETGLNVDLSRPNDLRDALVELLRDRDLARRFGAAGQRRWRQHFCYTAFRERFSVLLSGFAKE